MEQTTQCSGNSSDTSSECPSRSAEAKPLQWEPPGFLDENLDILTTIIIGNSHLPNRSTGIPLYVHRLVIEFVCSVYFIFSVLCQITGGRRQNATKA